MIKKTKVQYTVYSIEVNGIPVYIGRTQNIIRRTLEHNKLLSTEFTKPLYNHLKELGITKVTLIPLNTGLTKVESKRWEMFYILNIQLTGSKSLKQRIPCIMDSYK